MYTLMNMNDKILKFDIVGEGVNEVCKQTMLYVYLTWVDDIDTWIRNRNAAKHREHVKRILESCGINTLSGFIALTHCLSLTDTLWVKSDNEDITWGECNLYYNDFDDVMAKLSFDGNGLYGEQFSITSPELTTDGSFDKCWIRENDYTYLIKAGSTGFQNAGREPYSEVLASQVYEALGNSVKYSLSKFHGKVVSKCASFTSVEYGFKTAGEYGLQGMGIARLLEEYAKLGSEEEFRLMITGDCITINPDRHYGNFGFIIDNVLFKKICINPVFDFNLAFFPYADWFEGFDDMEVWQRKRGPVFGGSYQESFDIVSNSSIRSKLINLKDLYLQVDCDSTFTESRLKIINRFKNIQIDRLLGNKKQFGFADLKDAEGNRLSELFKQMEGNRRR